MNHETTIQEKKWPSMLVKKYGLTGDELLTYIEAFHTINGGKPIDPVSYTKFFGKPAPFSNPINLKDFMLLTVPTYNEHLETVITVKEAFNEIDTDADGFITFKQFKSLIYRLTDIFDSESVLEMKSHMLELATKSESMKVSFDLFQSFIDAYRLSHVK